MTFQPGDVVQVKSGGPALTVLEAGDSTARCLFYSDEKGEFEHVTLPLIAIAALIEDEDDEEEEDDEDASVEDSEDDDADDNTLKSDAH